MFIANSMRFHLVLECILAKPEGSNYVKRMRRFTRSQTEKINKSTNLHLCFEQGWVKLQKIGWHCEYIKSITMVHAALPPISGGCGRGELNRQVNALGFTTRRGLTAISSQDDLCFRDSVLFCLFSRKLYLQYVDVEEEKCKNHRRAFCRCRKLAEDKFLIDRTIGNTWHFSV